MCQHTAEKRQISCRKGLRAGHGAAEQRELPPLHDGGQGTPGVGHEVSRFSPGEVDGAMLQNDNAPTEAGACRIAMWGYVLTPACRRVAARPMRPAANISAVDGSGTIAVTSMLSATKIEP